MNEQIPANSIPEDGSISFTYNKQNMFAVRKNGALFLYSNSCPHLGIALEWVENQFLDTSKTMIQCANHGALFVIENGNCVSGPCSGKKLTAIPFDIVDGIICPR